MPSRPQSNGESRHIRQYPARGITTREPGGWASVPRARAMRMKAALPAERVLQEFELEESEMGVPSASGMEEDVRFAENPMY
jgi:hypothetical protein